MKPFQLAQWRGVCSAKSDVTRRKALRLFERASVLVCFDHVASVIVMTARIGCDMDQPYLTTPSAARHAIHHRSCSSGHSCADHGRQTVFTVGQRNDDDAD